jgi:hypothetical protein
MKALLIGYIICAIISVPLTIKYGNKSKINLIDAAFITVAGPIIVLMVVYKVTNNICVANCGE